MPEFLVVMTENAGDIFVSPSNQGLWKISGSTMRKTTKLLLNETWTVEAVNNSDFLMVGANSGIIVVDRNDGELIDTWSGDSPAPVLAVSDDGEYCAAVLRDDQARILFFRR